MSVALKVGAVVLGAAALLVALPELVVLSTKIGAK
jgi:hypothetical protein